LLPFLAELDNSESFETNLSFFKLNSVNSAEKATKKILFEKLQVSDAKTKEIFFKKISWSQMIQNCPIQREMAKKKFGGRRKGCIMNTPPPLILVYLVFIVFTRICLMRQKI